MKAVAPYVTVCSGAGVVDVVVSPSWSIGRRRKKKCLFSKIFLSGFVYRTSDNNICNRKIQIGGDGEGIFERNLIENAGGLTFFFYRILLSVLVFFSLCT